jgi:hypothetical protein
VFDQEMIKNGCTSKSYNLAAPSLNLKEYNFIIESIKKKQAGKKIIVLLYPFVDVILNENKEHYFTSRQIETTTFKETIKSFMGSKTWSYKIYSIKLYLANSLGLGRIGNHLFNSIYQIGNFPLNQSGWWGLEDQFGKESRRHQEFLKEVNAFNQKNIDFSTISDSSKKTVSTSTINEFVLAKQSNDLEFMFIVPQLNNRDQYLSLNSLFGPVINYNPINAQELFKSGLWFDRGHLNTSGAKLLSKKLAADYCRRLLE